MTLRRLYGLLHVGRPLRGRWDPRVFMFYICPLHTGLDSSLDQSVRPEPPVDTAQRQVQLAMVDTRTTGTRQQPGLACEECRRRKARCDRVRPQCGICAEAGRKCVVVDKSSQRGPKKGQLKDLRSRVGE